MSLRLNPQILYTAYSQGYFPMPDDRTGEILWYRPDPRTIFPLDQFHVSRSLRRTLNKKIFKVTFNKAFREVMEGCADRKETWIDEEFIAAYSRLHSIGAAQSVEVWQDGTLVGGVYGVSFGGGFFAESMFHRATDASKVALYFLIEKLKERRFILLEAQFMTPHLGRLGAIEISDREYMEILAKALALDVYFKAS